nr:uncharacterized protein PF11_0213 isoform X3 [Drosophila virilis]
MVDINLPRVPEGLRDLVKAYTKEVLHEKPKNLYEFSVQYFENIAAQRMDKNVVKYEPQQTYQIIMKNRIRQQVPLSLAFQIIPENLTDVIKKFIKAVLKERPQFLIIFAIEYFKNLQTDSAQIEDIKYAAYEKYILQNRMKSPPTKVTCECGRILNPKEIGTQLKNTLSDASQQYTSLENHKMNQYSKAVYIIQKHFRLYLKRKTENSAKVNSKTPDIYNKQEYLNAIILIQRQFRRLLLKNRANNTKLNNVSRESYNSVKYIKATLIIQRYIRQYLSKKNQERSLLKFIDSTAGDNVSHIAAAFVIQRVFRRMVKARKTKPNTNTELEQCDDINDNASEAASYTSASTALISSESAGEHNEFGNASYEEGVHQQTIKEDEEVENDNTNNKMECVTGSIKSSKKSINYNGKDISEPLLEDHGDENANGQKDQHKDTKTDDKTDKTSEFQTEIHNVDITEYNFNVNEQADDNIKTVQDDINIKESITKLSPQIDSLESIEESQAGVIIPSLKSPIGENNELVSESIISPMKILLEEANMKPLSQTSTSILEPEKRLSPSDTNDTAPVCYQNAPLEATNSSMESADYNKVNENPSILTATTSAKCNNENIVNANNLVLNIHDTLNKPLLEDHGDENTNGQKNRQNDKKIDAGDKTSELQTQIDNNNITEYNVKENERAEDNLKTVQDDINIKESITKLSPQIDNLESMQESQAGVIIPSLKSPIGENNELVSESIMSVSPKKILIEEANMKPLSPTSTSILEPEKRLSPSDTNDTAPVCYQNAPLEATNSSRESADYNKVNENPSILTATTSAKCNNENIVNANNLVLNIHDTLNKPLLEDHGDENTNGQKNRQNDKKIDAGDKTSELQTQIDNNNITEYNVKENERAEDNLKTVQDDINIKESITKLSPQIDNLESMQESQAGVIIPSLKSPIGENNELVSESIMSVSPKKILIEEANMKPLSPTSTSILEPEKRLSPSDTNNTAPVCYQNAPLEATNSSRESADYDKVNENPLNLTATTSAKCNNENIVNANNLDISVDDSLNEPLLEDHGDVNSNGQKDQQKDIKTDAGDKTLELQTEIHNVNEQAEDNIKTVQNDINIKESITKLSPQIDSLESIQESQAGVIIPSLKSPIGEHNELVSESIISPMKILLEEANMKPLSPTSTSILEPEKRLSPSDTNNTAPVCYQNAPLEVTNSSMESGDYDKVDQNPSILTATTSAKCNNENIVNANNLVINVQDNLNEPLLEDHGDENTNGQKNRKNGTKTDAGDKTSELQTQIDNNNIIEYNVNVNERAEDNIKTVQDDINIKESITKLSPQIDSLESIQESQAGVIIPSLKSPIGENNELVSESIMSVSPKKILIEEANMKPLSPTSTSILEPEKRLSPSDTNNTAPVCYQNAPLEATNSSMESGDYDKVDQNPPILTATTSAKCNNQNIVNANKLASNKNSEEEETGPLVTEVNTAGSTNEDEFDLVKDLKACSEAGPDYKEGVQTKLSSKEEPNSHVPLRQDNGSNELHEIELVKKTDSFTNIYDDRADNETDTKKEYELHPQNEIQSDLDNLNSRTLKLSRPDEIIEKMSQRRSSETQESLEKEVFPITDAIYEKPFVQPMSSLQEQNSVDIEDADIIVYNRLQREETRESSAQSESIVFGNADDDKALTNDVEITRSHLSRYYTIAGDDPHSIFKSGTIVDPVKYIDEGNEQGVNEPNMSSSLCLDDETSENIRKKIMAYSLSEADSDYYDTNKTIKDDYHIDTAMTDVIDTSTETESTIVSAAAKIKPGARGISSRRRLRGASAGTKSSTQDTKASFGNDALNESLERFIEEEAAKKIQIAYRLHKKNPRKQTKGLESVSLENSLAAKRQTLQRGDALQNDSNSTPEDENTDHLPIIVSKNDGPNNERSSSKTSGMRVTWTALRQNSMPVQIDCEVLRIIPKHKRRRIKSAEAGKQKHRK